MDRVYRELPITAMNRTPWPVLENSRYFSFKHYDDMILYGLRPAT